jgi:hypothetical protein
MRSLRASLDFAYYEANHRPHQTFMADTITNYADYTKCK